jgi:hypothetical protein
MWGLAAVFVISGAGMLWLWRLAQGGKLPRNRWAGVRTRNTMSSDSAWLAAHHAAAWSFGITGLTFLTSAFALLATQSEESAPTVVSITTAVLVTGVIVVGGIQGDRAARRA